MARIFVYNGTEYPDPDPKLTVDEVRRFMTTFFPELSNAETKESKRGEDTIYELKRRVGTKGVVDTESNVPCRLGYCVKKDSHYQGGDDTVRNKLRNGICPICGGPTERKYQGG